MGASECCYLSWTEMSSLTLTQKPYCMNTRHTAEVDCSHEGNLLVCLSTLLNPLGGDTGWCTAGVLSVRKGK